MADVIRLVFRFTDRSVCVVKGCYAWTLDALISANDRGVAPIERPAPRWSHYVDILRDRHGLNIETIEERHGGPFKGWHGRHVLRSEVEVLERRCA